MTAYAVQRHFPSQRSAGIVDARLDFKLETALWQRGRPITHQPAWIELFAALLRKKRGNVQFGCVVGLPWDTEGLHAHHSLTGCAEGSEMARSMPASPQLIDHIDLSVVPCGGGVPR